MSWVWAKLAVGAVLMATRGQAAWPALGGDLRRLRSGEQCMRDGPGVREFPLGLLPARRRGRLLVLVGLGRWLDSATEQRSRLLATARHRSRHPARRGTGLAALRGAEGPGSRGTGSVLDALRPLGAGPAYARARSSCWPGRSPEVFGRAAAVAVQRAEPPTSLPEPRTDPRPARFTSATRSTPGSWADDLRVRAGRRDTDPVRVHRGRSTRAGRSTRSATNGSGCSSLCWKATRAWRTATAWTDSSDRPTTVSRPAAVPWSAATRGRARGPSGSERTADPSGAEGRPLVVAEDPTAVEPDRLARVVRGDEQGPFLVDPGADPATTFGPRSTATGRPRAGRARPSARRAAGRLRRAAGGPIRGRRGPRRGRGPGSGSSTERGVVGQRGGHGADLGGGLFQPGEDVQPDPQQESGPRRASRPARGGCRRVSARRPPRRSASGYPSAGRRARSRRRPRSTATAAARASRGWWDEGEAVAQSGRGRG